MKVNEYIDDSPNSEWSDWHSISSIQLGELMEAGFDPFGDANFPTDGWVDVKYEQMFKSMFALYYKHQEIGVTPPGVWRDYFTAYVIMRLPAYTPYLQAMHDNADQLSASDVYGETQNALSDFPASNISGEKSYASSGSKTLNQIVTRGDWQKKVSNLKNYDDPITNFVKSCGHLFMQVEFIEGV